jgi:hypothetical protein
MDVDLNADQLSWEQQPGETDEQHSMFVAFRDSEARDPKMFDRAEYTRRGWSSEQAAELSDLWKWKYRVHQYDRHQRAVETEELARYRRQMNDRQRATARLAQQKVANWLIALQEGELRPSEAIRLLEVAAQLERRAAADVDVSPLLDIDPTIEDDLAQISPGAR